MSKRFLYLLLSSIALAACQPATPPAPTPNPVLAAPTCNQPGEVIVAKVEETQRGYPLPYGIYLPPCYEAEAERRYPIIYLVPGRNGAPSAWFAVGVNEVADDLILSGSMPPFILVTTENTNADPQADAILTDLIPYIESHYRTLADRAHRAVGGASLGGIAAYRIGLRFPDQYASIGIFGSGVIHGEEEQVQAWLDALTPETTPRVFLNCGTEDPLMLERTNVTIEMLDRVGIASTSIVSAGGHNYDYWMSNIADYFKWVAEDW